MKNRKRDIGGFTIIEALIAMVILSVGILSLGVLQLTAIKNTQGGYMQSQATVFAYDILDAMRANLPGAAAGAYNIGMGDPTPAVVNCYGIAANCSTAEIATSDLVRWRTILNETLPSGSGQVATVDAGATNRVTVTVQWMDPLTAVDGPEQLTLVTELLK